MPRQPRTTRSRKPKMSLAKAKKMVTKNRKVKAKKNMDTFFLKARYSGVITPQQGAIVANYVYFNPSLVNATDATAITNNSEFKLYQAQYDKVRINSMRLVVRPRGTVLDQVLAQDDAKINGTGQNTVYTAIDRDGKVPANVPRVLRMPSYKKYGATKTFSRSYAVKYPTGVWLDCQNIFEDQTLINRLGLNGSIVVYGENLIEDNLEIFNEPWADFDLYFNCVFQGKTSASISLDNSGNIVITPDVQTPVYPAETAQLMLGHITGAKRYDASGNLVTYSDTATP